MTTRQYRRRLLLFRVALLSLLTLGASRLLLDTFRKNLGSRSRYSVRMPVDVSDEETIDDGCNVFEGKWVWDNVTRPAYGEETCPFLVKQTMCLRNGRPDSYYQQWRWQPHGCNLPRFDGMKLLEMLRNKRIMFVGDSVQRGMFESMVCLLHYAIHSRVKTSLQRIPPRKVFKVEEFNASIEYYWAPFIVESISDHATNHTVMKRLVKLDSVAKHSQEWRGVDVLVFESYIWWMYKPTINATYGSLDNIQEINVTTAYKVALETWANWLDSSIDPSTQKVFYVTMSPTHLWSWEWKPGTDRNCYNETHPIKRSSYWGTGSNLDIMGILEDILGKIKVNVTLLNITRLSELRKDGHPSIFGERKGKLLTKEQKLDPKNYADCIHWCLPGVPDTWNEILYALLLQDYRAL